MTETELTAMIADTDAVLAEPYFPERVKKAVRHVKVLATAIDILQNELNNLRVQLDRCEAELWGFKNGNDI